MEAGSLTSVRVFTEAQMRVPESCNLGNGTAVVFSRCSPAKSTANEDVAMVLPLSEESAVLAIADGMGGGMAGERAAALAIESLVAEFQGYDDCQPESMLRGKILDGIERANQAVLDLGLGAGTTLAVVEVRGRTIRPYHVGDSLILVAGNRGKIKLQTVAHSPVGYGVEAGLLGESEAMHHEDRHVVSNMVGSTDMRIEIGAPLTLRPRDTVLLASDGLSDNLRVDEIVEFIRKGPLSRHVKQLTGEARRRMEQPQAELPSKPDDLTVVAFRLKTQRRCQTGGGQTTATTLAAASEGDTPLIPTAFQRRDQGESRSGIDASHMRNQTGRVAGPERAGDPSALSSESRS